MIFTCNIYYNIIGGIFNPGKKIIEKMKSIEEIKNKIAVSDNEED